MLGIIFIGIQASGKSTFYKKFFFDNYVRISMDLLNTRNKENTFLSVCLKMHQKIVIDNTNPSVSDRQKYINLLQEYKYKITGYYFESKIKEALFRNNKRTGKLKVNERGILSTYNKLEIPKLDEGFDELFYVKIKNDNFIIEEWQNEI